ncbi:class II fumarate hydratase [Opitutus terrae]|uniref:Fumarate hydratase class II n=1 Tax=Opitutus terrae (strain DSM 11246 / JCM 15787 / PB90-1) TaxID=452637 RepID=B1ZTH8_OPITP|nr:class II fumarate hydratase [Opitutus terrae]ACB73923.1 fumarate lyase [Opitutus terrae PB90-1]
MRTEKDSMGEMPVPDDALYGASTQRAVLNFPVSGRPLPEAFVRGLGVVKLACARANEELGLLPREKSTLIQQVAREIADGKLNAHFPIDVFQTGSATSTNMNANEVIANRASQLAGLPIGAKKLLHPNDDVNLGQSSNDIIPTTLHVSVALAVHHQLVPALDQLATALARKATEFAGVVKIGRTHLMDATPLTLGQEFSGYAAQARKAAERARLAVTMLAELAVGGTAVGTGINCHAEFPGRVCRILSAETGLDFREAANHFEAQGARDDCVAVAGQLSTIAASLTKIANDIRLLGSGPRAGLGELRLPATQPGSSIMPGKVNPVMSEMLVQVCLYTHGLMQTVTLCGRDGHFELNVTLPLMAHCLHESIHCLANATRVFAEKCVDGLEADVVRCRELVDRSLMLVTALNPHIGYDQAAAVAKEALKTGRTLREIVLERKLMEPAALDRALDPVAMTKPNATVAGAGGG